MFTSTTLLKTLYNEVNKLKSLVSNIWKENIRTGRTGFSFFRLLVVNKNDVFNKKNTTSSQVWDLRRRQSLRSIKICLPYKTKWYFQGIFGFQSLKKSSNEKPYSVYNKLFYKKAIKKTLPLNRFYHRIFFQPKWD